MNLEVKLAWGKRIIDEWDESRQPFVLYLRDFSVSPTYGDGFLLENHLFATLSLDAVGVLNLLDQSKPHVPGFSGHGAPCLQVPHANWQKVIVGLIAKAVAVVAEVPLLSEGSQFELLSCLEQGRMPYTVVVIPPAGALVALDDDPIIKRFVRVLHADEVPRLHAVQHFVFRDLFDRARRLASLNAKKRTKLVDSGEDATAYPLDIASLVHGYRSAALNYEDQKRYQPALRALFQALVVAGALRDTWRQARLAQEISAALWKAKEYETARNYLRGGITLARQAGDERFTQRLEIQLESLTPMKFQ